MWGSRDTKLRLATVAISVASALSLLAASASDAWAGWTAPSEISAAGTATSGAQIATDEAGDATAVWVNGPSTGSIKSAYLPAGGTWEAPQTPISTTTCHDPALAVDPAGAAVVVAACGSASANMEAAYRPAGGAWGSLEGVPGSGPAEQARVDLDDAGNATVVWDDETVKEVQSSYRPAGGAWGEAKQVSPVSDEALLPDLDVSPTGIETAIWLHEVSSSEIKVETKDRQGGAAWSGAVEVLTHSGTQKAISEPHVHWNANGQRMAVWGLSATPTIMQERWGGVGSWSEEISIQPASDGERGVEEPDLALDEQGRAAAVWRSYENPPGIWGAQTSTTTSLNASWASPTTLFSVGLNGFGLNGFSGAKPPVIAGDPAGDAATVWVAANNTAYAALRPVGGAFGSVTTISSGLGAKEGAQVAMDPGGDSFAAWTTGSGEKRVAFALDDGTPPVLSGIDVPVSGETGTAVAMSASATDSWSPPVTIDWDFGDGSIATGDSVSHAYATAGTKTVTLTATDAVGNTSTPQTRQVVVTQGAGEGHKPRVTLGVSIPKQPWKAIAKARAVKLRCSLDVAGACKATAKVTGAVAERLGLARGKGKKPVQIGSGSVQSTRANHLTTLKVKLKRKVLAAIRRARKNVPVKLAVTGSAPGRRSATLTRTLTIKRP